MEGHPESLSILVVCDGNVCRSPSAQFALSLRLPDARVESAGMRARSGAFLCEVVAGEIAAEGPDAERPDAEGSDAERSDGIVFAAEFRSRRLADVHLAGFDLVLAATTEIRADLARMHPELRDRFFTLREAADVLSEMLEVGNPLEPTDPTSLIAAMNGFRGARPTTGDMPPRVRMRVLDPLDIPDAHGERAKRHHAVVDLALRSAASVGDSLARLPLSAAPNES